MDAPLSYCDAMSDPSLPDVHRQYHDNVYGYPITNDNELFGRLILELNQAGLSWTTILNKESNFRSAYAGFHVARVAAFGSDDRERLLSDAGIIRNRLKVNAAIHNAGKIIDLQREFGSFKHWLDAQVGFTKDEWVKLFKSRFKFTGGEITNEFLLSTGYLAGAHVPDCPVYKKILSLKPPWLSIPSSET
jgi:DNA-3-methyladenine glycosylase I